MGKVCARSDLVLSMSRGKEKRPWRLLGLLGLEAVLQPETSRFSAIAFCRWTEGGVRSVVLWLFMGFILYGKKDFVRFLMAILRFYRARRVFCIVLFV